jgi:hypothetical protein
MENNSMNKPTLTDLQVFRNIFGEDKVKVYPDKLEYRGINNLEATVAQANRIIKINKLKLVVNSSGQLASYKAFEVLAVDDLEAAAA